MKCPGSPQCPLCASPISLHGKGLLEQPSLSCFVPLISSPGRETPLEPELPEIEPNESFKEPLGTASLSLSDQQGYSVDVSCNITHSSSSPDITSELSVFQSSPLPLTLSLSLECHAERHSYEKLWRIMAYYSETAVRLERELMLSKAPQLAYRYRQVAETEGYYHTGVKASVRASPQWLLQPAISIQLNRAMSKRKSVHLIFSTRVSARSDLTSQPSASHPWVLILNNHTTTALSAVTGSKVELPCPILSSGNPKVEWIFPDGSRIISPSVSSDGKWKALSSGLLLQKLMQSDSGLYYCIVSSGKDVDVLPLQLAVEESAVPSIREQVGHTVSGIVGQLLSLSCNASGSPLPYMSWLLPNGNIIWRGLAMSGGITVNVNGSLTLPNPSLRDAGHYRCIAVNQYGSDSLSTQLQLKPRQTPPHRTSFPRGLQSAAGRSTSIRAHLLRFDEGSGDGGEKEERPVRSRRPRPLNPSLNRQHFNQRRGGPTRNEPISPIGRRNRFGNKHRVTTNRQRIDPQKWADLLAKIRQKTIATNNSETAEQEETGNEISAAKDERGNGEGMEEEGSSVDDTTLLEEGLHPIYFVNTATNSQTNTKIDPSTLRSSVNPATQPDTLTTSALEAITTVKPISTTAETVQEVVVQQEPKTPLSRPLQPNVLPSARPPNPWNTRRRIGQRRRIINRTRGQLLTPNQPLPNPITQSSQATPDTVSDTTPSPAPVLTPSIHIRTTISASSAMDQSTVATHSVSPSFPPSRSSLSPMRTQSHLHAITHSVSTPESTITPLPTHSYIVGSRTQASAEMHTSTGKRTERPLSKHTNDTERNLFGVPNSFDIVISSAAPHSKITTAPSTILKSIHSTFLAGSTTSPTTADSEDALLTVSLSSPVTTKPAASTTTAIFIPASTVTCTTSAPTTISTSYITPPTTTTLPTSTSISKISLNNAPSTASPTTTTTFRTQLISVHTSPTTTKSTAPLIPTTTTTTITSSTSVFTKERPRINSVDPRVTLIPGTPGQSRHHTDWRKPGLANTIPDSQSSRTNLVPSSSLPAFPRVSQIQGKSIRYFQVQRELSPSRTFPQHECCACTEFKPYQNNKNDKNTMI